MLYKPSLRIHITSLHNLQTIERQKAKWPDHEGYRSPTSRSEAMTTWNYTSSPLTYAIMQWYLMKSGDIFTTTPMNTACLLHIYILCYAYPFLGLSIPRSLLCVASYSLSLCLSSYLSIRERVVYF